MFVPLPDDTYVEWRDFKVKKGGTDTFLSQCRWDVDGAMWYAEHPTRHRGLVIRMLDGGLFGHPSVN